MSLKENLATTIITQRAVPRESHDRIYKKAETSIFGFVLVGFSAILVLSAVVLLALQVIGVWILLILLLMAIVLISAGSFFVSREVAEVAWKTIIDGAARIIPLVRGKKNGTTNSRTNTSSGRETGPT